LHSKGNIGTSQLLLFVNLSQVSKVSIFWSDTPNGVQNVTGVVSVESTVLWPGCDLLVLVSKKGSELVSDSKWRNIIFPTEFSIDIGLLSGQTPSFVNTPDVMSLLILWNATEVSSAVSTTMVNSSLSKWEDSVRFPENWGSGVLLGFTWGSSVPHEWHGNFTVESIVSPEEVVFSSQGD
jgi:hypothetical protein